jgi:hypothetical protein
MAESTPTIDFENVPLDETRRMSRGPQIAPELYNALEQKIHSLDNAAPRLALPDGASPTSMKNRIFRVAAELNISVTIRNVPGGLRCWHSTDEDLQQATEVVQRLQLARKPPRTTRRCTRRRR